MCRSKRLLLHFCCRVGLGAVCCVVYGGCLGRLRQGVGSGRACHGPVGFLTRNRDKGSIGTDVAQVVGARRLRMRLSQPCRHGARRGIFWNRRHGRRFAVQLPWHWRPHPEYKRGTERMAVQKSRKSNSRRGMRRSHNALKAPTLTTDAQSGEMRLRHHVGPQGSYRGRQLQLTRKRKDKAEAEAEDTAQE